MSGFQKFEDCETWQLARNLVGRIYRISSRFPKEEKYSLISQIRSSALSVPSNIAEAIGRFHYLTKVNFLYNARGSLTETKSHLIIAHDLKFVSVEDFDTLLCEIKTIEVKINNMISATYKIHSRR